MHYVKIKKNTNFIGIILVKNHFWTLCLDNILTSKFIEMKYKMNMQRLKFIYFLFTNGA